MRDINRLIFILCIPLILLSCRAKSKNQVATGVEEDSVSIPGQAAGTLSETVPMTVSGNDAPRAAPAASSSQAIINRSIALSAFDTFLATRPNDAFLPEDVKIGELEDSRNSSESVQAVILLAQGFLGSLKSGKADASSFPAEKKVPIAAALRAAVSANDLPTAYRLGKVRIEEDQARANVLLFRDSASAAGELYFAKDGGIWRLDDFSVPFEDLSKTGEKAVRYEPDQYSLTSR
jgi:hypothetical protein